MQINSRHGKTTIKLLQVEERKLRDAAYMARLAAKNLDDLDPMADELNKAFLALMWLVGQGTTGANAAKLDAQDRQEPEVPVKAGPMLAEERGALGK